MDNKICFLFGHATAPHDTAAYVEAAAQRHYLEYGIRTFVVGNRGDFDRCAAAAIKSLKRRCHDISLLLLIAYHPAERDVDLSEGFDNSFYPPLEDVPRRYAILRANRYMVDNADSIICYAEHIGNSRNLLEYARSRQEERGIFIENIAEISFLKSDIDVRTDKIPYNHQ